jgi:hypothetical protein
MKSLYLNQHDQGSANHPQAARLAPAEWPSRSADMSKRLAQKGKVFGNRERLSLPDCPLILRSKMATLLRLPGADEPIGRFFRIKGQTFYLAI